MRSLNLSRRHLTLAQKKEVAEHIFEREPGRTANSVAEEVGLSPKTAQKVQEEVVDSYLDFPNKGNGAGLVEQSYAGSQAVAATASPADGPPGEEMPPAPIPAPERKETSGRKARGRKPLPPEEKARSATGCSLSCGFGVKSASPRPLGAPSFFAKQIQVGFKARRSS